MYSPCPTGFLTSYGSTHRPNFVQEYLNECFADMVASLPRLDFCILGGDLIDGVQPKSEGHYIWEPDSEWQAMAALAFLEPVKAKLKRGAKVLSVEGTEYHDKNCADWAEYIAREMGCEPDAFGHCAHDWIQDGRVGGIRLDIAHCQSYTMVNRGMPLERELRYMLIEAAEREGQTAHGIIRHHTHSSWVTHGAGLREAVAVPSWQIQTHYARTGKTPNRIRSAYIGSALVKVTPSAVERNDAPVKFERLLYKHPERAPIAIVE